jgi:hypothetical protein
MTTLIRWVVVTVLVGHGLLHLLGVAKGFGWAEVSQLKHPIGPGTGSVWLLAAGLVLGSAELIAARAPTWWWAIALAGAAISQVAIATSWSDAKYGTAANLILVIAAGYGFASLGPTSFQAQFHDQAGLALADTASTPKALVTEQDLAGLPEPLAAYLRRSGAVGKPRVTSFSAQFHGRIRSGPGAAWMPFTGEQLNTYGPRPQRVFIMDATRSGLPVTVLHSFRDTKRETLNSRVIYNFHPMFRDAEFTYLYGNDSLAHEPATVEGGDVTVIGNRSVMIGMGERSTPQGWRPWPAHCSPSGQSTPSSRWSCPASGRSCTSTRR